MLSTPKLIGNYTIDTMNKIMGVNRVDHSPEEGILMISHYSLGHYLHTKDEFPKLQEYSKQDDQYMQSYGVCDDIDQWKDYYSKLIDDENRKFCVSFTAIHKKNEPERDGWRWHKWGAYIGNKNPQHEYIYDEDHDIETVYVYHIYEIFK